MRKFRYHIDNHIDSDILFIDGDKRYKWSQKGVWIDTRGNPILNQWATDVLEGKRYGFKEINIKYYYESF